MESSENVEGREVEEEEEEAEEEEDGGEAQKKEMVGKVQRYHHMSVCDDKEERRNGKGKQKKSKTSQSKTDLGEIGEVALSLYVAAKCQCCSGRTAKNGSGDKMQQEVQESRWMETTPKRWKQLKGEDRTEMKKEARLLRWVHFAQWADVEYMRRYKGRCGIFFGIEHRLRKEEMEEQFNREAKEGWGFAADAARITDERASSEDRRHTSGGVLVAVDRYLGAVVGAEKGAVVSNPGNEGRIAQSWVNVRGGLRVFSVYFWHSEDWTPRNEALLEAVLKQARTTRHSCLTACDANMCLEDFDKSFWFQKCM